MSLRREILVLPSCSRRDGESFGYGGCGAHWKTGASSWWAGISELCQWRSDTVCESQYCRLGMVECLHKVLWLISLRVPQVLAFLADGVPVRQCSSMGQWCGLGVAGGSARYEDSWCPVAHVRISVLEEDNTNKPNSSHILCGSCSVVVSSFTYQSGSCSLRVVSSFSHLLPSLIASTTLVVGYFCDEAAGRPN